MEITRKEFAELAARVATLESRTQPTTGYIDVDDIYMDDDANDAEQSKATSHAVGEVAPVTMEVGRRYRRLDGNVISVTECHPAAECKWYTDDGLCRYDDGVAPYCCDGEQIVGYADAPAAEAAPTYANGETPMVNDVVRCSAAFAGDRSVARINGPQVVVEIGPGFTCGLPARLATLIRRAAPPPASSFDKYVAEINGDMSEQARKVGEQIANEVIAKAAPQPASGNSLAIVARDAAERAGAILSGSEKELSFFAASAQAVAAAAIERHEQSKVKSEPASDPRDRNGKLLKVGDRITNGKYTAKVTAIVSGNLENDSDNYAVHSAVPSELWEIVDAEPQPASEKSQVQELIDEFRRLADSEGNDPIRCSRMHFADWHDMLQEFAARVKKLEAANARFAAASQWTYSQRPDSGKGGDA